jgi:virulence-associated protein VagC
VRLPFRMALSEVRIRVQKSGNELLLDPIFGQKIGTVDEQYAAEVTMFGQPRFSQSESTEAGEAGDVVPTQGYVTVSAREIRRLNLSPSQLKNAKITGFKRLHNAAAEIDEVDLQITEVRPRGHLTGGPVIFKLFFQKFKDRRGGRRV